MKLLNSMLLAVGLSVCASQAHAQLVVTGKNDAALCYDYALRGDMGSRHAIETCGAGLKEILPKKDRAATYVNRGILFMRKGDQAAASLDFNKAIGIQPNLTEAYVNYGASLIRQKKLDEALKALNTALDDKNSKTRPEALYNRAIIFDQQENFKGAYRDLKAALEIRPDWEAAQILLNQYQVVKAG